MRFIFIFTSSIRFWPLYFEKYFFESVLFTISLSLYFENLTEGSFPKFWLNVKISQIGSSSLHYKYNSIEYNFISPIEGKSIRVEREIVKSSFRVPSQKTSL